MYTPGVVSYITGILSSEGINIVHVESSYRDTIIVLSKQDASRAFNLLINLLEAIRTLNNKMFRST
jgi:predicted amino acid-binding ACT domain protein